LQEVNYIACEDTRTSSVLLKHFNIDKRTVSYHKFNEKEKTYSIINDLLSGMSVALISDAGCPCISDPGSILVHEAILNNIEVISVPGASAITSSIMVSGMPSKSFAFYGFLDRENKKIEEELLRMKKDSCNIFVIYESPKRIIKTLKKIEEVLNNPYICLCNDLTKKFEKKYYGDVSNVLKQLDSNPNKELGEYVLLIENPHIEEEKENISVEALIIDEMIKNNCTLKDAIKLVSVKYHYNKNIVYNASLNLKKMF